MQAKIAVQIVDQLEEIEEILTLFGNKNAHFIMVLFVIMY